MAVKKHSFKKPGKEGVGWGEVYSVDTKTCNGHTFGSGRDPACSTKAPDELLPLASLRVGFI